MGQFLLLVVMALTVGAVVFGVTVLLTGSDRGLSTAEPDGRAVPLPGTRPLVESDIAGVRFDTALRGYRMVQVDQAMRRAAYDIGYKDELISVLEAEVAALRSGRLQDAEVLRRAREAAQAATSTDGEEAPAVIDLGPVSGEPGKTETAVEVPAIEEPFSSAAQSIDTDNSDEAAGHAGKPEAEPVETEADAATGPDEDVAEGAVPERAVTERAVADGETAEGALSEGAVTEGAVAGPVAERAEKRPAEPELRGDQGEPEPIGGERAGSERAGGELADDELTDDELAAVEPARAERAAAGADPADADRAGAGPAGGTAGDDPKSKSDSVLPSRRR